MPVLGRTPELPLEAGSRCLQSRKSSGRWILLTLGPTSIMQHDLTVVTRNTDRLERCGARCCNPWVGS